MTDRDDLRATVEPALGYARRYWQHGSDPETQAALTTLAQAVEHLLAEHPRENQ